MTNAKKISDPPYQMTAHEKKIIQKRAADRAAKSPSMKIARGRKVEPDHPDPLVGYELAFEEMGVDFDVGTGILNQMIKVAMRGSELDLNRLNFLLSFVKSLKPRDVLEASLISQIAVGHMRCMEAAHHAEAATTIDMRERHERRLTQFMRTFVRQIEALKRYRSSGEQKIVVQKMTVADGGQAIVGNVTKHEAPETPKPPPALAQQERTQMPLAEGNAVFTRKPGGDDYE